MEGFDRDHQLQVDFVGLGRGFEILRRVLILKFHLRQSCGRIVHFTRERSSSESAAAGLAVRP